jgi:hypothetical protein
MQQTALPTLIFTFVGFGGGLVVPEDNLHYPRRIIPEFAGWLATLFEVEVESRASAARRVSVLCATFVSWPESSEAVVRR